MADLIDRRMVIERCEIWRNRANVVHDRNGWWMADRLLKDINDLPSAHTEGEWVQNDNGTYSCNLCHSWLAKEHVYYARYCPFCGARMKGASND